MASPSTWGLSFHGSLYAKPHRLLYSSIPIAYYPQQNPNSKLSRKGKAKRLICRADFSQDAPLASAIGACILSSFVFPVAKRVEDEEEEEGEENSAIVSTDMRIAAMGIISFIPYFNWLLEASIANGDVQTLAFFKDTSQNFSSKKKLHFDSKGLIRNFFPLPLVAAAAMAPPAVARVYSTTTPSSPSEVSVKKVGTHNGSFHCDEALGCFMIRLSHKFSGADIVRTRDPKILGELDAVLDVGGVYDPDHDRYDHHQKGFQEVFGHGFNTKLSSAGLVYKHFGKEIIAKELNVDQDHPDVLRLFLAVYKSFMEAIDAVDNGINRYDTDQPPKYVNNTHLSSRVGRLNLDWIDPDQSQEKENEAFQLAMALAGKEFLEDERAKQWRVQAVAVAPDRFENRKALPEQWRGLRDEELSKAAEIPGCVFVHMSGFIGGNQSYDGALSMARTALTL
ncbi:hypothetical protein Bca4012_039632 [Brassica carinata]